MWSALRLLRRSYPVRHHLSLVTPARTVDLGETAATLECSASRLVRQRVQCGVDDGDVLRLISVDLTSGAIRTVSERPTTTAEGHSSEWLLLAQGAQVFGAVDPDGHEVRTWPGMPHGLVWMSSANDQRIVLTSWGDAPTAHIFAWR
jgi:hypothetical protein